MVKAEVKDIAFTEEVITVAAEDIRMNIINERAIELARARQIAV